MQIQLLTVTELTNRIKDHLETRFQVIWVEGEISNFRPASSGHWYFKIRDDRAVLDAVLFRGSQRDVSFPPDDGMLVRITGSISVYPPHGRYQLICRSMERSGSGDLLAMIEERKLRLSREGLFDAERKRDLPRFPSLVAVVTSPTGAAVRDVISVVERRNSPVHIKIYPTPVQGSDSPARIVEQIESINSENEADVIILTRGGGSLEDLLPFSDEKVVRSIAASKIPTISAVGHEINFSLADFAADVRVPTPSAAAEIVALSGDDVKRIIGDQRGNLVRSFRNRLSLIRSRLNRFYVDELIYRFRNFVQPWNQQVDEARNTLLLAMADLVRARRQRLVFARERIVSTSPFAALERGYAIVRDEETDMIISSAEFTAPKNIEIEWKDGKRKARIEDL